MSFIKGKGFVHDAGATPAAVQDALAADPAGARDALNFDVASALAGINSRSPKITPGKFVRKVALAGDSHHNMRVDASTAFTNAETQTGLEMYGSEFLEFVRPTGRARFNHAAGGSRVDLMLDGHAHASGTFTQVTELLALVTAGECDTVMISVGANDYWVVGFDLDVTMARYKTEIVEPLVAAGAIVVVCTIPPAEDVLVPTNGTPIANATEWNTRLYQEFGDMVDVLIMDNSFYFGRPDNRYRITEFWLGDGSHLNPSSALHNGRLYAAFLEQFIRPGQRVLENWEWVSPNPYITSVGAALNIWPSSPAGFPSATYQPRGGDQGRANERVARILADKDEQKYGTGNSAVLYTLTSAAITAKRCVMVNHFPVVGLGALEVNVYSFEDYSLIDILCPASNSTTLTVTAEQIRTAVLANAEALALVTPTFDGGDGSGIAVYSATATPWEVRCHAFATADAVAVSNGDYLRCYTEILPDSEVPFTIGKIVPQLYSSAGVVGSTGNYGNDMTWFPREPIPPPLPGRKLGITSPWWPSAGGRTQFTNRLMGHGSGAFRVLRHGVQRRIS